MTRRIRTGSRTTGGRALRRVLAIAIVPILALLAAPRSVSASGDSEVETRLKAAYIYNFARFVEWPARPGPIRISILGQGDLGAPLEQVVRGKVANGRAIEVTHITSMTDSDCCEILLIDRSESKHVREIVQTLAGKPVLTVSDQENGLRDGVMIAFQLFEESVRFQVNQEAAEHAGLKISSQLLKVALPWVGKRQ